MSISNKKLNLPPLPVWTRISRSKQSISIVLVSTLVMTTLPSCAVGPEYQRPSLPLPNTWTSPLPNPLPHQGNAAKLRDWWASWGDSTLVALIENAQRENPTVAIAAARIDQARAAYTSAASPLWPRAGVNANDSRSRTSAIRSGIGGSGNNVRPAEIDRVRSASFDTAWEIDLFGGTRRAIEAATARATARDFDWPPRL